MSTTPTRKPAPLHRQRGIITALAAVILVAAVLYVLTQSLGIIGKTSQSNQTQGESIAAFFLAESGLERGRGLLRAASDRTAASACSDINGFTLDGQTVIVSGVPSGCSGSSGCTTCKLTSTGVVGSSSRTVVSVMSIDPPSGGATGCGGGGGGGTPFDPSYVNPANCAGVTAPDLHPNIEQSIEVTAADIKPMVLMSNLAYKRHPPGVGGTAAFSKDCVLTGTANATCTTGWNDQSNKTPGDPVVGARGATVPAPATGTYTFKQNLTADTPFAAVGAKFPALAGAVTVKGSYWDDANPKGTVDNSAGTSFSGDVNDGTACTVAAPPTCPIETPQAIPPAPPTFETSQASKHWCYDADTLVFGFSGSSKSTGSGKLTGFIFGTAPSSMTKEIPGGLAEFPKPSGTTKSRIFSTLRFINNTNYTPSTIPAESAGATSYPVAAKGSVGAIVTGTIGATFKGNAGTKVGSVITLSSTLNVTNTASCPACIWSPGDIIIGGEDANGNPIPTTISSVAGNTITVSAPIYASNNTSFSATSDKFNVLTIPQGYLCNGDSIAGASIQLASPACNNASGLYTLSAKTQLISTATQNISSLTLRATGKTGGNLTSGDVVSGTGVTAGTTITGPPVTDTGGADLYPISIAQLVAPTILTQGFGGASSGFVTITLPAGVTLPNVDTEIAVYSGNGDFGTLAIGSPAVSYKASATVQALSVPDKFTVKLRSGITTISPITDASLCGGMCAFFNHTSLNDSKTPFTVTVSDTEQWAGGMTCMNGVNVSKITGLSSTSSDVKATSWSELIK